MKTNKTDFKGPEPTTAQFYITDEFKKDLASLLNKYSFENRSNTPDFILAEYLFSCLEAFEKASYIRETWYNQHLKI
jgi:hypothetical protein